MSEYVFVSQNINVLLWGLNHRKFQNSQTRIVLRCDNCSSTTSFWLMSESQRIFWDLNHRISSSEDFQWVFSSVLYLTSKTVNELWMNLNWTLTPKETSIFFILIYVVNPNQILSKLEDITWSYKLSLFYFLVIEHRQFTACSLSQ